MAGDDDSGGWRPSGIVTWTTDFGTCDPYVGIMQGVLLTRCPGARCVDLTHHVPAQDVRVAAFYVAHSWRWFPRGTVHVVVVDPGVGTSRRILLARRAGHVFLAPDNGVLCGVLGDVPTLARGAPGVEQGDERDEPMVLELDVERFALEGKSSTFHGRDVFAPAAAALALGLAPTAAGRPLAGDWDRGPRWPLPLRGDAVIATEVLLVDHFGNLVTALVPDEREGDLTRWEVEIASHVIPCAKTYGAVGPGELLALVDSYGHLEIAVRDGDAAERLGVGAGAPLEFRRKTT